MTAKEAIEKFYEKMMETIEEAEKQNFPREELIRELERGCEQIKNELIAEI